MICIPTDAPDSAFSGMIIEALCVSGSEMVIPTYYDKVLECKVARDDASEEMLDIIRAGITHNFGLTYAPALSGGGQILRYAINHNQSIPVWYASYGSKYTADFDEFIKSFE